MKPPSCSPFSQLITAEFSYQGTLYRATALPLDGEGVWEVYLSSGELSTYFTMSQTRRAPHNAFTVQQRAIAFVSDGKWFSP